MRMTEWQSDRVTMDVKTACLGVLAFADASGYEIRKAFEEGAFAHFAEGAFGSIYPALKQLERDDNIAATSPDPQDRPGKKVFRITPKGRLALLDALAQPPAPDRFKSDFLFNLLFAEFLPAGRVEMLVDNRIAHYRALVDGMERCRCRPDGSMMAGGHAFVHGFGLAVYRAATAYLEDHKHEIVGASLQASQNAAD